MTTLHVQEVAGHALVSREELDQLVALARRSDDVQLEVKASPADEEMSTSQLTALLQQSGALAWLQREDELYSESDLKVRYR
jgi:hypothetical protein